MKTVANLTAFVSSKIRKIINGIVFYQPNKTDEYVIETALFSFKIYFFNLNFKQKQYCSSTVVLNFTATQMIIYVEFQIDHIAQLILVSPCFCLVTMQTIFSL